MDDYIPIQQSTYAVNIFKYRTNFEGANYVIGNYASLAMHLAVRSSNQSDHSITLAITC